MQNNTASTSEKTSLVAYLKPLTLLLTVCGCGKLASPSLARRFLYTSWTFLILTTLALSFSFQLVRLVLSVEWTKVDLDKALTILILVWQFQVIWTACLAIYLARGHRYERFEELWRRSQFVNSYEQKSVRWLRLVQISCSIGTVLFASSLFGACTLGNNDLIERLPAVDLAQQFNVSEHFNNFYTVAFTISGFIWLGTLCVYALICFATGALAESLSKEIADHALRAQLLGGESQLSLIANWSDKHLKLVALGLYCSDTFSLYTACMIATNIPIQIMLLYILVIDSDAPTSLRVNCVIWQGALFCQLWCILSAAYLHSKFNSIRESFAVWYGLQTSAGQRQKDAEVDEDHQFYSDMELHCHAGGFLARCQTLEVGVTAASLFKITRGSILTIFSVIISYFTILIQLAQSRPADIKV